MAKCPNKNLKEWKDLVAAVGETTAHGLWDEFDGNVPLEKYSLYGGTLDTFDNDSRKIINEILTPIREATHAMRILSEKDNMVVMSTVQRLLESNFPNYITLSRNGVMHLNTDKLSRDVYKELGEGVLSEETKQDIKAFTEAMNNVSGVKARVTKYISNVKNIIKEHKSLISKVKDELKDPNSNLVSVLINTPTNQYSADPAININLKAGDGNIYNYYWSKGALKSISKQYKKTSLFGKKEQTVTGYDNVERDSDDFIEAMAEHERFEKNRTRLKKAINILIIDKLNHTINRLEEDISNPNIIEEWERDQRDMNREMSQMNEYDIRDIAVDHTIRRVLQSNGIINDRNELSDTLGFTSDALLKAKNNENYNNLKKKQILINKIINNKERYNSAEDNYEIRFEDGDVAAPIPGWFIDAVSVNNTGKLLKEHTGFMAGLVRGVILMTAQEQYDAQLDKGTVPPFIQLARETDLNSRLVDGTRLKEKMDLNSQIAIFNQADDMEQSIASDALVTQMKQLALDMGINFTSLLNYSKSNPAMDITNINGLADLTKKTIAIAQGREGHAITEEVVHLSTAMMEQTDPKLITDLISKITKFKIYQKTFDVYKKKKAYQLADGRPNIRMIKKEAVDKLIAEVIVNGSKNEGQFPELREQTDEAMVKSWWAKILDKIRRYYNLSDIDLFQKAADKITSGKAGTTSNISSNGVFTQALHKSAKVEEIFEHIKSISNRMDLKNEDSPDRHYTLDEIRLLSSVTEKLSKNKDMEPRTSEEKISDDFMKMWGTEGHRYIEDYINNYLIDKATGFAFDTPKDGDIVNALEPEVAEALQLFAKKLIKSYPKGTRFILEPYVVNEKEAGGLGSKIDFVAIVPTEDPDSGEMGAVVDVLDWKFMHMNPEYREDQDIPWYKQRDWKFQMGEYSKMIELYGKGTYKVRKARMIPFIMNYVDLTREEKIEEGIDVNEKQLYAESIEIGDLNNLKETEMYLLPVPIASESTGNVEIDNLLSALNEHYRAMSAGTAQNAQQKKEKIEILNPLSKAIRKLQVTKDFRPLANVGRTYLNSLEKSLFKYEMMDYSTLDPAELRIALEELLGFKRSAQKFRHIEDAYVSEYERDSLDVDQQKVLDNLHAVAIKTKEVIPKIDDFIGRFAMELAVSEGIIPESHKREVLFPEREVSNFSKTFLEASKLSHTIIKLATRIIERTKSAVDIDFKEKMIPFREKVVALEKSARSRGVSAFSLIGKKGDEILELYQKLDPAFIQKMNDSLEDKKKDFILKNIDIDTYNEKVNKIIDRQTRIINDTTFFADDAAKDEQEKDRRLTNLRNTYDINLDSFTGWKNPTVKRALEDSYKTEGNLSKEYKSMETNPAALAMWEWFTARNEEAEEMGYIGRQGTAFVPLIEATIIQKLGATDNIISELGDIHRDLYTGRIDENKGYSKVDVETGEVRKTIPKYYTKTNKRVSQLSTDINLLGSLYQKSLLDYQNAKNIEYTLLALHNVEKVKGRLNLDEKGNIVGGGKPITDSNKNLNILDTIINDSIYGLNLEQGGLDSAIISGSVTQVTKMTKAGEATGVEAVKKEIAVKKGLENANTLIRVLGVGLKPLIALANWSGFQFQAMVNSGSNYTFKEFEKNNLKVTTSTLSKVQRGLLDLFTPYNDDIVADQRRKTGKEISFFERINTWTFTDVLMSTNHFPERALQAANALSFFENGMVVEGKIVNIRQHVRAQDRLAREKALLDGNPFTTEQRKQQRDTFQSRVDTLKASKSLLNVAEMNDKGITLPGVSTQTLADYRLKIQDFSRKLNGQMSADNKAGYRRSVLMKGFLMFKTWIPKLVHTRVHDLQYNANQGDWEYGKANLWFGEVAKLSFATISRTRNIILGTKEGLEIMDEILMKKKQAYYDKHGKELTITSEEFYDLVQREVANQVKELASIVSLLTIVVAAKTAEPPEDATRLERNRYKHFLKALHKISEEMTFYYNPTSMFSITKGSVFPALGILAKLEAILMSLGNEVRGHYLNDEKIKKDAKPLKYFLNIIPGAYQYQVGIQPFLSDESAEASSNRGVIITAQARRN